MAARRVRWRVLSSEVSERRCEGRRHAFGDGQRDWGGDLESGASAASSSGSGGVNGGEWWKKDDLESRQVPERKTSPLVQQT